MKPILCYGEVLWDLLPSGKVLGGAPLNVAYRLQEFGQKVLFVSSVGDDQLGKEIQTRINALGVSNLLNVHSTLSTGVVEVTIQPDGSATYLITEPVAWDEIPFEGPWDGDLLFGSLALRNIHNQEHIFKTLQTSKRVYFDVNLRAPFINYTLIESLIDRCTIVKFNEEEFEWFAQQQNWESGGSAGLEAFKNKYPGVQLCITKGEDGAIFMTDRGIYQAKAPQVNVQDTIGAGDAFFARLIAGYLRGESAQLLLQESCQVGAIVATQKGATSPLK